MRPSQPTLMSLLHQLATGAAGSAGARGRWGSGGCGGGVVSCPLFPELACSSRPGSGSQGLSSCEYLEDLCGLDFGALILSP